MATVLVIGATGRQGGAVADLLLDRGHEVTAYVRSPDSPCARPVPQLPLHQVRQGAGDEIADMFQRFEDTPISSTSSACTPGTRR